MNNTIDIKYLSELIEPQIQSACWHTESNLQCHLQLQPEVAHQSVILALRNIISREIRWQQPTEQSQRPTRPEGQMMHLYADSDLAAPVMDIPVE